MSHKLALVVGRSSPTPTGDMMPFSGDEQPTDADSPLPLALDGGPLVRDDSDARVTVREQ
jgi:hypothetical protein